jgi:predicted GNAT family N-acyltransferase
MTVRSPQTEQEWEQYYQLRYEVLRKPWNQPLGSEKDKDDATSQHLALFDERGDVMGVCRLQLNSPLEAQVRYMAVSPKVQGQSKGNLLMQAAEEAARKQGAEKLILQARENAVRFYERNGYKVVETSYLLFNSIQHYLMEKYIA